MKLHNRIDVHVNTMHTYITQCIIGWCRTANTSSARNRPAFRLGYHLGIHRCRHLVQV